MRFAIANHAKIEASPGLIGSCPACGSPVVSKCGRNRVWHWAHKGNRNCDPWWEPETEWHRSWKAQFPVDQQEVRQQANDGEWHIADVKTERSVVFEFQHSHLALEERISRDAFYGNLIWVVDGTRLKRIAKQFFTGFQSNYPGSLLWRDDTFHSIRADYCDFPAEWKDCIHPVCFDFNTSGEPKRVWCLFPEDVQGYRIVRKIEVKELVRLALTSGDPVSRNYFVSIMRNSIQKALHLDLFGTK